MSRPFKIRVSIGSICLSAIYSILLTLSFAAYLIFRPDGVVQSSTHWDAYSYMLSEGRLSHPIDTLIHDARRRHDQVLVQRSTSVKSAAAKYRARRGRHPPPGFDKWVEYALKHDAVLIEQFFDRIEDDIRPFWGLEPADIRAKAAVAADHFVRVRDGAAKGVGDTFNRPPWLELWTDLVGEAAKWLPDLDMPINYMDESRLLVPWEDIDGLVRVGGSTTNVTPVKDTVQQFSQMEAPSQATKPDWIHQGGPWYWDLARAACPPDSLARQAPALTNFASFPTLPHNWRPSFAETGFVENATAASNPCLQPHLREMHGTFVEPISMSTSRHLFPLFSGCKLPMNNDILIPGAMYLTSKEMYSGGSSHGPPWEAKTGGVVWRGVASGGRHKEENWTRFQRLRLVEMLNGTTVSSVQYSVTARPQTFELEPMLTTYSPSQASTGLGDWLTDIADAGFTELLCFPRDGNCSYLAPYFHVVEKIPMDQQYKQKFIPDVDGNSFSARFRALLLSTSLPLKATIYAEWHDNRLQPWLHYAPMDNTFRDLYATLDFFMRDDKGDAAAKMISHEGKMWAEKVLRREDMLLYVWRVLLEFARVQDVNREWLGFVEDLI